MSRTARALTLTALIVALPQILGIINSIFVFGFTAFLTTLLILPFLPLVLLLRSGPQPPQYWTAIVGARALASLAVTGWAYWEFYRAFIID